MSETPNQAMARLMRETADLIERGLLLSWSVDVSYGVGEEPDWRTGGYRLYNTGERTVKIELHGNDLQTADWQRAATGVPAISSGPKRLVRS